ncbi:MAG: hypothetical protein ACOH2A_15295 [Sphingobacteriaceae bacterium]
MKFLQRTAAFPLALRPQLVLLLLLAFGCSTLKAQDFGGNPPRVKWWQVKTPAARIIFPAGLDSSAQRVAAIMQYLNRYTPQTIGDKQKPVNVILQNQTTISNGYVGLGPFRSEFFMTPPQNSFDLGSTPWPDQLAIHEFRHVQQYNNFNRGLSKAVSILFGEQGQGLANSMAVPNWFFEGDAVFNETHLSQQGRGRLPYFYNGFRSLWQANKNYSWLKLRNGSYRDYVPDHYQLGYLLVAYGREKYGDEFWKDVTLDAAAFKGLFYPLQRAIKKHTGSNYRTFRTAAIDAFKQEFAAEPAAKNPAPAAKHFEANLTFPAFVNDSTLVYVKTTYSKVPAFMLRHGEVEKQIRIRDDSPDNQFSYANGKIVYTAFRPNLRWGNTDYLELRLLDVYTGKQRTLTKRSKYFSPALSDDGKTIVAVHAGANGKSELHLINAANGHLLSVLPNPENHFYTYPKFDAQQQVITAVRNAEGKMALASIDPVNGKTLYLTPLSFQVLGFPDVQRDTVYFTASFGKADRLFAFSLKDRQLFRLKQADINTALGNYQPAAGDTQLAWTSFTATGYVLHQTAKKDIQWESVAANTLAADPENFGVTALNHPSPAKLEQIPNLQLPVSKYRKTTGLLNFHSLDPAFDDPNYSLKLISENVLNTLQASVTGAYNRNEHYKQVSATAIYGAWFPYISVASSYLFDRRIRLGGDQVYYNEWQAQAGYNLPFNLSQGRRQTALNVGADYVYDQPNFRGKYAAQIGNRSYSYLNNYLRFSNSTLRARQDINPRFGQSLSANYKHALTRHDANQLLLRGNLFFPGLLRNHSLLLAGAFQQKDALGFINFSNDFPFSRGYAAESLRRMHKWSVNYLFPIWYPDAGLANVVYVLRLRGNLFYDQTRVSDALNNGKPFQANFRSTGSEIFVDAKLWNQLPITVGLRYSRLLDPDLFGGQRANRFELVLPLSLF